MAEDTTFPLESNQPEESNNLDMEETTEELQSNDTTVDPQDDTTVDPQDEILEEPSRPMSDEKKSGRVRGSLQLPISRVRTIMKFDPDVSLAGHETVFLIAKCTEIFISRLTQTAYQSTVQSKRKTIQKKDVDQSISHHDYLTFLEGILG